MLLIIAAPDVRDHLSDREVSTVLFLPTSIGSMVGELPRALDISEQWIPIMLQASQTPTQLLSLLILAFVLSRNKKIMTRDRHIAETIE